MDMAIQCSAVNKFERLLLFRRVWIVVYRAGNNPVHINQSVFSIAHAQLC